MQTVQHVEKHFTASEILRDIVIGMSDGLTVPFALAAGLSGAVSSSHIIVTAGFAEIVAGSIAMGLGGYLATKGDIEHYQAEKQRERLEVLEIPGDEKAEIQAVFRTYGLTDEESSPIIEALSKRPKDWVNFMMRFELGLEKIDPKRALVSALTIAGAYATGGIVPLLPYILVNKVHEAFMISVIMTLFALVIFGFLKGHFAGTSAIKSASQTVIIGGIAALAAFLIAKAIS